MISVNMHGNHTFLIERATANALFLAVPSDKRMPSCVPSDN